MLAAVAVNLYRQPRLDRSTGWVALGSRGALGGIVVFMSTMDRVYTTPAFWLVLGMVLVAGRGVKRKGSTDHSS